MLEKVDLKRKVSEEEYRAKIGALKEKLTGLDAPVKEKKLPVIVLFEGWSGAGKGSVIQKLILNFDPRWFSVVNMLPPTEEDKREPMMWRHWKTIPAAGQWSIMDQSWYQEISVMRVENEVDEITNLRHVNEINSFEKGLVDNGYVIIKFFLHISKKEMRKRQEKLSRKKSTQWRVTEKDRRMLHEYKTYYQAFDSMLESTNRPYAQWHVISGSDKETAILEIFQIMIDEVTKALKLKEERDRSASSLSAVIDPGQYNFVSMPLLKDVDMNKFLEEDEYRILLKREQKRLKENHNRLYLHRVPMIIAYEGWDAAGKGGNIKRVSAALDPRGYEVMPIASPTKEEKDRHFLWRFWTRLPKDGHIAIFDRTWYGRVMVERLEGFCTTADWQRAYGEMNDFERQLYDWGAVIVKFWINITNDEQLKRFNARQADPAKQWKITDEDWRNREKWDQYETAVNDMIRYTSTDFAPWHIIDGNNKYYARVRALQIIDDMIEKRLEGIED